MHFTVLTLFPDLVDTFFDHGIIGRAMAAGQITGNSINIRDFSRNRHHTVDDRPYGGGCGMVMTPGPLTRAIDKALAFTPGARVILLSPQGRRFDQGKATELAACSQDLVFVCGRYEGIDERIDILRIDEELSIGDYVMTGGELAAMVVIDAVARLIPGVLGKAGSAEADSFIGDRLEHAHYTRPEVFNGFAVPDILLSGNHEKIRKWRKDSALKRTFLKRPDLFEKQKPSEEEKQILRQWCRQLEKLVNE